MNPPTPHTPPAQPPLVIRTDQDILAMLPVFFGFHPHESLVLLAVRQGRPFSARVDLPPEGDPALADEVARNLSVAALRQGAQDAFVVVYSDDAARARWSALPLAAALEEHGIEVHVVLRFDGVASRRLDVAGEGEPTVVDLSSHPVTSRAVFEGRVTHRDRDTLVASLECHDAEFAARVAAAYERTSRAPGAALAAEEAAWLTAYVRRCTTRGIEPGRPARVARVLRALGDITVRDAAWMLINRENAREHVTWWTSVVQHAPEDLVAAPAALLAFAAWLEGNGALAWCAIDRSRAGDPDHRLTGLVARALETATPPTVWDAESMGSATG